MMEVGKVGKQGCLHPVAHRPGQIALGSGIDHHDLAGGKRHVHHLLQLLAEKPGADGEFISRQTDGLAFLQKKEDLFFDASSIEDPQDLGIHIAILLGNPFAFARRLIAQHPAATNSRSRRITAHHITVPRPDSNGLLKKKLDAGCLSRQQFILQQQGDTTHNLSRPQMDTDSGSMFKGFFVAGKIEEFAIKHVSGLKTTRSSRHHPPFDQSGINPLEVDGSSMPCLNLLHGLGMHLQSPHLGDQLGGIKTQLVADRDPPGNGGAGNHRPKPFHGKYPIHRQPEWPMHFFEFLTADKAVKFVFKFSNTFARKRRYPYQRGIFKEAADTEIPHLLLDQIQPFRLHHIFLGDDDNALLDPEQTADLKMFPGLRHDPFIGGDNKGHQVHAHNPGDHVLDKLLMTGDIDNPQTMAAGEVKIGKAQLNRDAALFLFLEPVGFNTGQGPDQTGLAMINMACGAEDNFTHRNSEVRRQ